MLIIVNYFMGLQLLDSITHLLLHKKHFELFILILCIFSDIFLNSSLKENFTVFPGQSNRTIFSAAYIN